MKKSVLTLTVLLAALAGCAQNVLTLDTCYTRAKQQYPLIRQKNLIEQTKDYNLDNISKGYLPQVTFSGQVTYQSAVTSIPSINMPNFQLDIPTPSQTQFNVHGEVVQTIYDGGAAKQQKELYATGAAAQEQNIEVQLYALHDRVNQLFFGILLIDRQLEQNKLVQQDIQNSIDRVSAAVKAGSVLSSNVTELEAELLKQKQNEITLKSARKSYLDVLSLFINQPLDQNTVLQTPALPSPVAEIHRPELTFFDMQRNSNSVQTLLLKATRRPKISFFFQGGYALPGLNAFEPDPQLYYITGLRLNWSLSSFYYYKNQVQLLNVDRQALDIQQEVFILNTRISMKQQNAEAEKLQQLIALDEQIIAKRTEVKNAAKAQLDNGSSTVHDYLNQLNAEDLAKQSLLLHQVQLLMAQFNYNYVSGN